jgi:hypothetical protein
LLQRWYQTKPKKNYLEKLGYLFAAILQYKILRTCEFIECEDENCSSATVSKD